MLLMLLHTRTTTQHVHMWRQGLQRSNLKLRDKQVSLHARGLYPVVQVSVSYSVVLADIGRTISLFAASP